MTDRSTFIHCRCPHCRHPLDQVECTTNACPQCNQPLEPERVWLTRRYPGEINLSWWCEIFTWPLVIIIFGITVFYLKYAAHWDIPRRGWLIHTATAAFAVGLVRVIYILAMKGRH